MKCYPDPLRFGGGSGPFIEWQTDFILDDQKASSGLGCTLPAHLEDLLDIAMAAYVCDRLRPRDTGARGESDWSRDLALQIAVRSGCWKRPEVSESLVELLGYLTDDQWRIEFLPPPAIRRFSETQPPLFASDQPSPSARFALFSGGLDSGAGAARDLFENDDDLVLVSAGSSAPLRSLQGELARRLAAEADARVRSVVIPIGLRRHTFDVFGSGRGESTQRTRGFVFLVLGAVAAAACGSSELRVYENGPGALNLAQSAAQTGAMTTRAMRPETLLLMGGLMTAVLGRRFRIVNPSFTRTKAELLWAVDERFWPALTRSKSCDTALTHRASDKRICGICTSCLLRRQSLRACGREDIDNQEATTLRYDVRQSPADDPSLAALHLMLAQAARIEAACRTPTPWPHLVRAFPELLSAARALRSEHEQPQTLLTRLLARYASEWRALPSALSDRYLSAA